METNQLNFKWGFVLPQRQTSSDILNIFELFTKQIYSLYMGAYGEIL